MVGVLVGRREERLVEGWLIRCDWTMAIRSVVVELEFRTRLGRVRHLACGSTGGGGVLNEGEGDVEEGQMGQVLPAGHMIRYADQPRGVAV